MRLALDPSAWDFVRLLASCFHRHGLGHGWLLALRCVSEGVQPALSTLLLAFYQAHDEARAEWSRRRW